MKQRNGYLTVYLTLCLTLVLSLYLVLIDGARRNGAGLEATCAAEAGLQSIMAEYHRELFRQYNLFAIDSSYGTVMCGKKNTEAHLMEYIKENLDIENVLLSDYLYRDFFGLSADNVELTKVSILTDGGGAVFRARAIEVIRDDVGWHILEELKDWMQVIEVNGLDTYVPEEEKREIDEKIEEFNGKEIQVSQEQSVCVEIVNPTKQIEGKRHSGILNLVTERDLSDRVIETDGLIKSRMEQGNISRGNMTIQECEDLISRFLFQEYLLRYMGCFGKEQEEDALQYQLEYLIVGQSMDTDNLKGVVKRVSVMREAANAIHLLTDKEKKLEIQGAAALACGIFALPELIPLVEAAILLGWAYAESVYDVKTLLAGGKVPLLKDRESWHYSLEDALTGDLHDSGENEKGLSYEDYLRILMTLTDLDLLTARAMNMVEADIRQTAGNSSFRLDACFDRLQATVYISSSFGYEFELNRERTY